MDRWARIQFGRIHFGEKPWKTMKTHEKPTWNHEKPWKTMKNQPGTMKNHNHHWIWVSWAKWSFFVTAPIIYKSIHKHEYNHQVQTGVVPLVPRHHPPAPLIPPSPALLSSIHKHEYNHQVQTGVVPLVLRRRPPAPPPPSLLSEGVTELWFKVSWSSWWLW